MCREAPDRNSIGGGVAVPQLSRNLGIRHTRAIATGTSKTAIDALARAQQDKLRSQSRQNTPGMTAEHAKERGYLCESWIDLRKGFGSVGNGVRVGCRSSKKEVQRGYWRNNEDEERRVLSRVGRYQEPIHQLGGFDRRVRDWETGEKKEKERS